MKKFLSVIVAFGIIITPLNSFAQTEQKDNSTELITAILSMSMLTSLIISLSDNDNPVSP